MSTAPASFADVDLQLALTAVAAGHHDPRQAGRDRAGQASARLTSALLVVAGAVAAFDASVLYAAVL